MICDGIERNQLVIVANAKPGSELTSEPIKMFFVSFSADIGLFFFCLTSFRRWVITGDFANSTSLVFSHITRLNINKISHCDYLV